jgi:large-conductance mechanosensitive channel
MAKRGEDFMVPIIGLMIGSYIIVRMFSFALRSGERKESGFVQVISVLNILFTFILMAALVFSGASSGIGK